MDRVRDAGGAETIQIVTVDVATGARTQVTHVPPAPEPADRLPTCCSAFVDDDTISFQSFANPDGLNPEGKATLFSVKTDGSGLEALPRPIAIPGDQFVPQFIITSDRPVAGSLALDGVPINSIPGDPELNQILELFVFDGQTLLQLTNFQRVDTIGGIVDVDGQHAYFEASANPPELGGTNPSENCQLFSIDRTGGGLRQLTSFGEGEHTASGCTFNLGPGCGIAEYIQDAITQTLVFYSSCDPLGTNPYGGQFFAMHPDGTGLRQISAARGRFTDTDGVFHMELPGPWGYGPYRF